MIKFLDLKLITDSYEPEITEAVKRVISSGWYLLGQEVRCFEEEYANYIGTKHCIGVGNGLDALRLILRAYIQLGVMSEGDEIIVPANTFIATILAITDNKLVPILVDPDISTYNIDSNIIEQKITVKTRGMMIVHLYGRNAITPDIQRMVDRYDLKLIEDNAQAAGAYYGNKRTGSVGHAAGHSFYPGKNLGALGDGGAVTTNDDELSTIIRTLSNYGSSKKYIHDFQGVNSRLDEIQAAVLRIKLKRLDSDNQKRKEIAEYYSINICNPNVSVPVSKEFFHNATLNLKQSHVWHLFVIRHPKRDDLQEYLTKEGIQTLIHYPVPPHRQAALIELVKLKLPVTQMIHKEILSLPISPVLGEKEVAKIVSVTNNFHI